MKPYTKSRFQFVCGLIALTLFSVGISQTDALTVRSEPLHRSLNRDSLPAGTRISIEIAVPGDATSNRIQYVIPAPLKPVVIDPLTITLYDGLVVGTRGDNRLIVKLWNGKTYLSELLPGGQILVRGPNLLNEKGVVSAYKSRISEFAGGATAYGGLTEPAGVVAPAGYLRKTFSDGAVYYVVGSPTGVVPPTPSPDPLPVPSSPGPEKTPTGALGSLQRSRAPSKLSDQPWGVNRLQVVHPPYQDNWVYKSEEIIVENAPGFPNETPDLLRQHGHNTFAASWFYDGDKPKPFGLPASDYRLYFEVTGSNWAPYRTVFDVLSADMQTIGENLTRRLPQFNTVRENGLIDGKPTILEAHFNPEYAWFGESGGGEPGNSWQSLSWEQRQRSFINYANDRRVETFQEVYNRAGVEGINQALHQKWRNVFGLSIQIMNRHSKPLRAYYGDYKGIAEFHNLLHWNRPYSPSDLFSSDVNDASRFGEANEGTNAGKLVLNGHDEYDVSGNLRRMANISHCYDYEWAVSMKPQDYDQFINTRGSGNIMQWQDKMKPDLYRPYYRAFHAQLTQYVKDKKGWNDYKVYWQTEPIYENSIQVEGRGEVGAWVGWTLDAREPFAPAKLPLHPEVANGIVYNARMLLDGLFVWGSIRKQYLSLGRSEGSNPQLHQTGREGLQRALDEINQHNVFGPDTKKFVGTVEVYNDERGQYLTGDANKLLFANGSRDGRPYKPVPLVTAVYRPSTGVELYSIYAIHQGRYDTTEVKFKSVVDGAELTATAVGWGPVLYSRTATTSR